MKLDSLAKVFSAQDLFAIRQIKLNGGATMVMNNNAAKQCMMRVLDVN